MSFCCSLLESPELWNCAVVKQKTSKYFRRFIAVRCLHLIIHTKMFQVFTCNLPLPSYEALLRRRTWACLFLEVQAWHGYVNLLNIRALIIFIIFPKACIAQYWCVFPVLNLLWMVVVFFFFNKFLFLIFIKFTNAIVKF